MNLCIICLHKRKRFHVCIYVQKCFSVYILSFLFFKLLYPSRSLLDDIYDGNAMLNSARHALLHSTLLIFLSLTKINTDDGKMHTYKLIKITQSQLRATLAHISKKIKLFYYTQKKIIVLRIFMMVLNFKLYSSCLIYHDSYIHLNILKHIIN